MTSWFLGQNSPGSSTPAPQAQDIVRVLLIGRSGNGKSSTGNTLLGRSLFEVSTGIVTCTTHIQLQEATRRHRHSDLRLQVVDLPDVCEVEDRHQATTEIQQCQTLTFPNPSVICLVVRADIRFTPEEYSTYRTTLDLLRRQSLDAKRARKRTRRFEEKEAAAGDQQTPKNLVVIFTKADVLSVEKQKSFEEDLQKANKELKQVLHDAQNRFVLLSNTHYTGGSVAPHHNRDAESKCTHLLDILLQTHRESAREPKVLRAVILGTAGTGKSSTGNCLLYPSAPFEVHMGLSSATSSCETEQAHLAGLDLEITDVPAWNGSSDEETLQDTIDSWLNHCRETPDLLLLVIKAHDRFQLHDFRFFTALKNLDPYLIDRVLVVFTGGDYVQQSQTAIEKLLHDAPDDLKRLMEEVENRYVLVNNQASSLMEKVFQRNILLAAMVDLLDRQKKQKGKYKKDRRRSSNLSGRSGNFREKEDSSNPPAHYGRRWGFNKICVVS